MKITTLFSAPHPPPKWRIMLEVWGLLTPGVNNPRSLLEGKHVQIVFYACHCVPHV